MRVSQILQNLTMGSALVVAAMTGMMFSAIGATEPLPLFDAPIKRMAFAGLFSIAVLGCALGSWLKRVAARSKRKTLQGVEKLTLEAARGRLGGILRSRNTRLRRESMMMLALEGPTDVIHCHDLGVASHRGRHQA